MLLCNGVAGGAECAEFGNCQGTAVGMTVPLKTPFYRLQARLNGPWPGPDPGQTIPST